MICLTNVVKDDLGNKARHIGSPEMSVYNQHAPRNKPEDGIFRFNR
jgi:hypothetical protein